MKKTILITGYSNTTLDEWENQLIGIFGKHINVEKKVLGDFNKTEDIQPDLVVVPMYSAYSIIEPWIPITSEVIIAKRTLNANAFRSLKALLNRKLLIVDETQEMSYQIAEVLLQIGIKNNLSFCGLEDYELFDYEKIITLGVNIPTIQDKKTCLNLGPPIFDISTLFEIGVRLDLDDVFNYRNIKVDGGMLISASRSLPFIMGKMNRAESSMDTLLEVADVGIFATKSSGEIFLYNDKLLDLFRLEQGNLLRYSGLTLFPEIPFIDVLQTSKAVEERLINIRGVNYAVSIKPITHSGKQYGAIAIIKKFEEEERKQHKLRKQLIAKGHYAKKTFSDIIGESDKLVECITIAKRMSKSNSSILITGESGVGKEIFAQAIHNDSSRSENQFVAINCGAIPENLLESELFGYEDGAFTGARKGGKLGLFELAHNGTIFLDEIGEMPIMLQKRLLRVLEEREIVRIGGERVIPVNVRVIAATNKDLKKMITENSFRQDLYYRVNVLSLKIPPLRERREDIPHLIEIYKKNLNGYFKFNKSAETALLNYNWPGNVRELKNCVEFLENLSKLEISEVDLPFETDLCNSKVETVDIQNDIEYQIADEKEFILKQLYENRNSFKRLGRRSLCKQARKMGFYLSEYKVRSILLELESQKFVKIFQGKAGTVITDLGIRYIEKMK